jgi:hypothetical protein
MNDTNDNQRVGIGKWALALFVIGLLVPIFVLARSESHHGAVKAAIGFGLMAEGLALLFGILGRKFLYGRIGMIGGIVVLGLVVVLMGVCHHRNKAPGNGPQNAHNLQVIPASKPSTAP